jgi:hypothetical protein
MGRFERSTVNYTPPTTADLRRLKDNLGFTGEQMAELFGLGGGQQWRKYTGGAEPREMSPQMLIFAAVRLTFGQKDIDRLLRCVREIGADMTLEPRKAIAGEESVTS